MVWSFQLFIVLGVENEFEVYGASSSNEYHRTFVFFWYMQINI